MFSIFDDSDSLVCMNAACLIYHSQTMPTLTYEGKEIVEVAVEPFGLVV